MGHHLGDRVEDAAGGRGGLLRWVGPSFYYDMEDTMKKGMTPESVEQMAQQIQQAGEDVQQAFQQIASRVSEFDWTGEDRDRFVSEFTDGLGQLAQQVNQQCGDFSERGTKNAAAQREASA